MKNLASMMKQAQEFQSKMAEVQEKLKSLEVIGASAAGMCEVTMNGKGEVLKLKIDPSLVDPGGTGVMEDLIIAALADAKSKSDNLMRDKMSDLTGGLALPPGMQLPF